MSSHFAVFILGLSLSLVPLLILAAVLLFELSIIVSAVNNKSLDDTARILRVVGMVIIHPFVALAYYFSEYRKKLNFS